MAIGVLARKAKEAEAKKLRERVLTVEGDPVGAALRAAEAGELQKRERSERVSDRLASGKALAVIAEYHRKTPGALRAQGVETYEIPGLDFVGAQSRAAGAAAFALNVDPATGGCTVGDVEEAVKEQKKARRDYPGPLPVIWTDVVVDEVQLAQAYAAGADALTLHYDALSPDAFATLTEKARDVYGLEIFAVVDAASSSSEEDEASESDSLSRRCAAAAAAADAIVLAGLAPGTDEARAKQALASLPENVAAVARVDANNDQDLAEAEFAWELRDIGFDAVWIADVLYKFGTFSGRLYESAPDSITSVIKAMRSKASAKWARAAGRFGGKGEGAKEYLGDLMM